MSELALQLIREAKEKRLTRLDLGNCGLTELPEELFELFWLEELILAEAWWNVEHTQKKYHHKKSFNNFTKNRIHTIPNRIQSLTKLYRIIASNNLISDLKPLSNLKHLRSLNFSGNKIADLTALTNISNLQYLNLVDNHIADISPLKNTTNLQELVLSKNYITDITPLAPLIKLQALFLVDNKITNLKPLEHLIQQGLRVSLQEHDIRETLRIGQNPLEIPPLSIVEQGNEAILNYFKQLEEQGTEQLNEAKLIIVGEPAAGKTSLMETLLNEDFDLSTPKSTLGVDVRMGWIFPHPTKPDDVFTSNIWDFGGQQIQYMTHQFFLTPSAAYVLVSANDRKEPTNFPYWFKIIHLLGEEQGRYSPVLVVLNEKDDKFINKFNFDRKFYEERYPELQIEVCEVNLDKRDEHFKAMRSRIQHMLCHLPHVTDPRPARWKDIRADLRARAETANHIDFNEYAAICSEHAIKDEPSQLVLSRYLHKLGSLLHFSDDPSLYNFIILNPQWAVDAVYSVLNDNQVAKADGYFTYQQLETIWQAKYYYDERCKLLSLMQKENFEICYPLDQQRFIAPQLLNAEQPNFTWDTKDNLRFRFQYKFMPEGIITRLIVRLNHLLARGENSKQLIWRKGAVFIERSCRALVQEEENRDGLKVIDIAINGKLHERKYFLSQISKEIQDIHHKWCRNIQSEQMIPCICSHCTKATQQDLKFFEYQTLIRALERGKATVECDKEFIDVSVKGLLEGVFEREQTEQFIHRREMIMTGNTYIVGDGSQLIVGNHNNQKTHSDNITITTTTTITKDQRQIMSAVLDELWERRDQLDKTQRKAVRDLQEVIEAEVIDTTPETQSKLGKVWQDLPEAMDFTNNSLEVAEKVVQHWPTLTAWVTAAAAYLGS